MAKVTVDFVAQQNSDNVWEVVLVEEGPWLDKTAAMTRLQAKVFDVVDAVLDGQLAERYPESCGCSVVIVVDCYDLDFDAAFKLLDRIDGYVNSSPEYSVSSFGADFVRSLNVRGNRPVQA